MRELRKQTFVHILNEEYFVSTVNISDMYYETMIFASSEEEVNYSHEYYCERYGTEQEALEGHYRTIEDIQWYINFKKS